VTVAPLHAIARHAPLSLALLAGVLAACSDSGAAGTTSRRGAAGAGREMEAAGDVVIEPPKERYTVAPAAAAGSVTGTIGLASPLAPAAPTPVGADSLVCGPTIPDSSVHQAAGGLGGVVVWLDGVRAGKPLPLEKRIELESNECRLTPRVQAAVTGGAVNVIGHDPFRQHLRFMVAGEDAPRVTVLLGKDEQVIPTELPLKAPGLVVVRDADHSWPRAWVAVFDHPYFAVTRPDGSYTIDGVPPGTYTLSTWHERTGRAERKVTVGASGAVKVDVRVAGK
jgi:hypothetical protein